MEQTVLMSENFDELDILVDKVIGEERYITLVINDETYGVVMRGSDLTECELAIHRVVEEGELSACLATLEVIESYGDLTILVEDPQVGATLTTLDIKNIHDILTALFTTEPMRLKFT